MIRSVLVATLSTLSLLSLGCSEDRNFAIIDTKESFGQSVERNGKVDILWVVDTSSSMAKHQKQLSEQTAPFLDFIQDERREIDFQMASITMDMSYGGNGGQFIGSPQYLTNTTANLAENFSSRILIGEGGSSVERGLESMKAFFEGQGSPAWSDFLREDALLIVIFVTNEDDQSRGQVQEYAEFLDQLKPTRIAGQNSWMAHVLGVLELEGECRTNYNYADPSLRLIELSQISHGRQGSICSGDLRNVLGDIRSRLVSQLTDFALDRPPVVKTLDVQIDRFKETSWGVIEYIGRESIAQDPTNGWIYIEEGNLLRFQGSAIPGEFDRVSVAFTPAKPK